MAYKEKIKGKTVYIYTEEEHYKALQYENLAHKSKKLLNLLGGGNNEEAS